MYTIVQTETHVTAPTDEERRELALADAELVLVADAEHEALVRAFRSADAVLFAAVPVTRGLLDQARRLRIVARLGTGVDNIDVAAATDLGIAVTNVPDFATDDVAEHAIALIFACAKQVPALDSAVRAGDWNARNEIRLGTVVGRTLGLVGFGRIGRTVARYATALGMLVLAYDPLLDPEEMLYFGQTEPVTSLRALLERADFVSLHAPLTPETRHMISTEELSLMKKTAYLINCGRGALLDEAALVEAVKSGVIAGAGLDVLEQEPPLPDSPVLACPAIVITPHCSAHTHRALTQLRRTAVRSILQALRGEWPDNVVNPEVRAKWQDRRT